MGKKFSFHTMEDIYGRYHDEVQFAKHGPFTFSYLASLSCSDDCVGLFSLQFDEKRFGYIYRSQKRKQELLHISLLENC